VEVSQEYRAVVEVRNEFRGCYGSKPDIEGLLWTYARNTGVAVEVLQEYGGS
jgi:hypothetical protein